MVGKARKLSKKGEIVEEFLKKYGKKVDWKNKQDVQNYQKLYAEIKEKELQEYRYGENGNSGYYDPERKKEINKKNREKYSSDEVYRNEKLRKAGEYYIRNGSTPETIAKRLKKYHDNPEKSHETRMRGYTKAKLECMLAYSKIWSNSDEIVCNFCGEKEILFLSLDHIDGRKTEKEKRGNEDPDGLYRRLRRESYPPTCQVLCQNCNMKKEIQRPKGNLNPTPKQLKQQIASKKYRKKLKFEIMIFYSKGKMECNCKHCKIADIDMLSIDHIDGRKNADHEDGKSSDEMYRWLRKKRYPRGFQVLCMNCNAGKRDRSECPHEK